MDPLLHRVADALAAEPEIAVPIERLAERVAPWLGASRDALPHLRALLGRHPGHFRLIAERESHAFAACWTAEARDAYAPALGAVPGPGRTRVALTRRPASPGGDAPAPVRLLERSLHALCAAPAPRGRVLRAIELGEELRAALARLTSDAERRSTTPAPGPLAPRQDRRVAPPP